MSQPQASQMVCIDWTDSAGTATWMNVSDLPNRCEISRCRSLGYLTFENDEYVVISQSYDITSDNVNHSLSIPKVNITNRRRVRF